jgi:DNA helicase-2/ATP-dependent DNA helicase PcrA
LIHKIFGPPGTGKTTFLLNTVEKQMSSGINPKQIGYFSFTKRAAVEAKQRAVRKFTETTEEDLNWFRTLHSLAFNCLGLKTTDIARIGDKNLEKFTEETGIQISEMRYDNDFYVRTDDPIFNAINVARVRGMDLKEYYQKSDLNCEWFQLEHYATEYKNFKERENLKDFTDILEELIEQKDRVPELHTVIIDEAQDLSKLQWKLVKILIDKCTDAFIAGDDDQAIYVWNGADVDGFLDLESDEVKILEQSYRVPSSVFPLAKKVITRVKNRQKKNWIPKVDSVGKIEVLDSYSYLCDERFQDKDVSKGEWLFLSPINITLNPLHEWLKSHGILFERNNQKSISDTVLSAVLGWENLRKGKDINYNTLKNIYKYLHKDAVAHGHKNLRKAPENELYTMEVLKKDYGLLTDKIWHESLTKIGEDKRSYIIAMLKRGIKLKKNADVRLSTIHNSKGTEAENVVVFTDMSNKSLTKSFVDDSEVRRLLYVAITRTKNKLFLIRPVDYQKSLMRFL